jgi:hypothetical protein
VLKGHQFKEIQDKFIVLSLPNVCNLVALFKHCSSGGYIDNILELKFIRIIIISSRNVTSHAKYLVRRSFFSRCLSMGLGTELGLLHKCSSRVIKKTFRSCLTIWSELLVGQWWFVMFMIQNIANSRALQFVKCNLKTPKHNKSCGQSSIAQCSNTCMLNLALRDSW